MRIEEILPDFTCVWHGLGLTVFVWYFTAATSNIRLQAPGTILQSPRILGPKQVIIQKPLQNSHVVTLVKTSQGLSVAQVPKGTIKAGTAGTILQPKMVPVQNKPTIVKVVPNALGAAGKLWQVRLGKKVE